MTNAQAALIAASNVVREQYVTGAAKDFKHWLDRQDEKTKENEHDSFQD